MAGQIVPLYPSNGQDASLVQGIPVSVVDPTSGQILVYDLATRQYVPTDYVPKAGGAFTGNLTLNGTANVAPNQTAASGSSLMTRDLSRFDSVVLNAPAQLVASNRYYSSRGGTNSAQFIGSNAAGFVDSSSNSQCQIYTNAATLDYTSWAEMLSAVFNIDQSNGSGTSSWGKPFVLSFRASATSINTGTPSKIHIGVSGNWVAGMPTGIGVGICYENGSLKLWANSGASFSITGVAGTDIITAAGHTFSNGDIIRFSSITGGSGLTAATPYWVINVSGSTFQLSTSSGGSAIDFTTDITAGTAPALPTYSSAIPGVTTVSDSQICRNFVIANDGLGTASLYYSEGNNIPAKPAIATIAVPSSGAGLLLFRSSITCTGSYSAGNKAALSLNGAKFYPFAV